MRTSASTIAVHQMIGLPWLGTWSWSCLESRHAEPRREWRWVTHGSVRLLLETGWWQDFEAGQSGGVLGLVHRLQGLNHYAALPATPRADNGVFNPCT